ASVTTTPFPARPLNSRQKDGESIQAFFRRRRESNMQKMATELRDVRQRRMQLEAHANKGGLPNKAHVFFWEKRDGHYIRIQATKGQFDDLWADYPASQRRYDSFHNEWDLAEIF
ncbi:hypothetical protein C8F04DRAFT_918001, partial [Mycena alexandri]